MKRLLFALLLLCLPLPAAAAITFNADCQGTTTGANSQACSFGASKPTTGDLVLVAVSMYKSTDVNMTIGTPTDNQSGNTYTLVNAIQKWNPSSTDTAAVALYYAKNVNVSGTYTVTDAPTGGGGCGANCQITVICLAFTSVDTTSPTDGTPGQQTTGANATTTAVMTGNANDVLTGDLTIQGGEAITDPSGYTVSTNGKQTNNSTNQALYTAYQVVAATASYQVQWTQTSDVYGAQAGFFKAAAGGGGCTGPTLALLGVGKCG